MKKSLLLFVIVGISASVFSCSGGGKENPTALPEKNLAIKDELPILDIILKDESNISTFLTVLDSAKMSWVLRQEDDAYIIFAPSNEAFQALGQDKINDLLKPENQQELNNIVRNHIVKGRVPYTLMAGGMQAEAENRKKLTFQKLEDESRTVNGIKIVKQDIEGKNGIVHIIDKVILPN
jgi:uncharacterized surface protein with fasciclin (FAS1) repeats